MLQDYVALVDDAELRIGLAQKHKCHDIVINVSCVTQSANQNRARHVQMTGCFVAQSDVPGPEGPPAVDKIPGKGGERLSRREEDR